MLTVRICTEYKFSNPYDSTLFILLLLLLLFLLLIFIPFYSVLYLFLSTLTFTILYPFYSVVGSSICLLVQACVNVLVGKKRKIFHSFLEKLYVWVFHPHWACRKYIHNQFYFVVLQLIVLTIECCFVCGVWGWCWWWK